MADTNKFETVACNFKKPKTDIEWVKFALKYLIAFYEEHKNNSEFQDKNEDYITDEIRDWIKKEKKNKEFNRKMTVNSQVKTENRKVEGYYDLKFESYSWKNSQKFFAIENKISEDNETSFKNYIYYPNKAKGSKKNRTYFDDGGMFRFLSNKYAQEQNYGGMIAFIKKGDVSKIQTNLTNKIKDLKIPNKNSFYGELINLQLLDLKIHNFDNSFQTNHIRKDGTEIHLIHLLFNFN